MYIFTYIHILYNDDDVFAQGPSFLLPFTFTRFERSLVGLRAHTPKHPVGPRAYIAGTHRGAGSPHFGTFLVPLPLLGAEFP